MKKILISFALLLLPLGCRAGFSSEAMKDHIRETYQMPASLEIDMSKPQKSGIPGFDLIELTFTVRGRKQTEKMYLSTDGRHYQLGDFKDLSVNPDNDRIAVMNIKESAYRGKKKAKVQVVEYTDFACFYCKRGYEFMRDKIMKDYKGEVLWVYKSMPLVSIHPWAKPAAVASECAKEQGMAKFWKMHDLFFEEQSSVNMANFEDKVKDFAQAAKVDQKKFDKCFDKGATLDYVNEDMAEANALGINGTPAFVVNGHMINGADYDSVKRVVEEALKGKHGKI